MDFIIEPSKKIPVYAVADICVVGGSATGVFAAVRAARLGAKVILIEKTNALGGVAGNGLVNVWHSLSDTSGRRQIIAGLSAEVMERLESVDRDKNGSFFFNPNEMKMELDALLAEHNIECCLHTCYAGLTRDGIGIGHIFIENKDGRSAVKADFYIDATGDGDLARDLGIESYQNENIQPPSACFLLQGSAAGIDITGIIDRYSDNPALKNDWGWSCRVPGLDNITMRADTHIFGLMCSRARELTEAEIRGRRHAREIVRLLRKYGHEGENYRIAALCSHIGIRETLHYRTRFQADELSLLLGKRYEDAVLNGTYSVDIHHADRGITFRHFDGTYNTVNADGTRTGGNWREEMGIGADLPVPTYYQVPFSLLVNESVPNFIAAGRMINADTGAFGALRVMINLNQLGEAAGVGAYTALQHNIPIQAVDGAEVAETLRAGGSANRG